MKWTMLGIVTVLLLGACGGESDDRPGNPEVYERIAAETDCAALQEEFDVAMDRAEALPAGDERKDAPLAYAEAADERLEEVGCYD